MIQPLDTGIIVVYMIAVTALGIWFGRGSRDLNAYLLGGRSLPWYAVLGSIVATETSTATFLSVPGLAYVIGGDLRFLQLAIGLIIGRLIVAAILLPGYFRGQIYTAYELLDQQFGPLTRRSASVLFLITRNLGDGLRLYLTGIALKAVTGLSLEVCIGVIGVATIIYTFLGGMKSVVWNDCLQFLVYTTGGAVALSVIIRMLPGGWTEFLAFGSAHHKFQLFDFQWNASDPHTVYAGVVGGAFLALGTHGTDQMMVQRYLSARSPRDARAALLLSGVVVALQFTLFLMLGIALACFYQHPPLAPFADKGDRVFADFIVNHLPMGLVGLCLASVFAAAMSTLSSSLNSSATALVNDFMVHPESDSAAGSRRLLRMSQVMTVVFGLIQIGVGIGAQYVTSSVVSSALAISGFTAGVLLGVFLLGMARTPPRQSSVLAGMVCGIIAVSLIQFGTTIAWPWLAVVGALVTTIASLLADLAIPRDTKRSASHSSGH